MTLLRRNEVRLFLTSFAILFVELLLIRWIPSNVKYIGFFSNFLLIASFLGIGLGILLGRKGWNPRVSPFAVLLACVVLYVFFFKLDVQIKSSNELFFGLAESNAVDQNFLILPLIVGLIVALMATLALPLGPLLKSMPPLKAYGIDITGSLAGIASFTILSALGTEPARLVHRRRDHRPGPRAGPPALVVQPGQRRGLGRGSDPCLPTGPGQLEGHLVAVLPHRRVH